MPSRREFELFLTLRGALGSDFSSSFRNARTELQTLRTSMSTVNSTLRDITAFKRQQDAIAENERKLEELQERHHELAEEMAQTETPSESLRRAMERNEGQILSLCDRIGDQRRELVELGNTLRNAGVNTDELTESTEELRRQYEHLADCRRNIEQVNSALDTNRQKLSEATSDLGKMTAAYAGAITAVYAATVNPAIEFESAFTGVKKTVDGTEQQLSAIRKDILLMSQTDVTASTDEIAAVAEAAGQLGIAIPYISSFSKTMIELEESTNLSAEEAASSLAKFANITKMPQTEFDRLGSVIVDLGNNMATTEADIVAMGTRLASTGELTGLTEAEIMAFAAALSSLGIEAEAGGSAASKFLKDFERAYAKGDMEQYANIAGMTAKEFKNLYEASKLGAVSAFTKGLNDVERNGKTAIEVLDEMDIKEIRYSNAVLALAASNDILTDATDIANNAWAENTALTVEAAKRYETTESRIEMTKNAAENLGIALGDLATPFVADLADDFTELLMHAQRFVRENGDTIAAFAKTALEVGGLIITLKGLQVTYLGIKGGILLAAKAVTTFTAIVATAKTMTGGLTFTNLIRAFSSVTGVALTSAAAIAGVVTAVLALGAAVWKQSKDVEAALKAGMSERLFDNGGKKISELHDEFIEATSAAQEFAEEVIATSEAHDEHTTAIAKAIDEIFLYNEALKESGGLSAEAAEKLKQPFEDLATTLKDDFAVSYSNVFSAFSRDAKQAAEDLGVEVSQISSILDAFNKKYNTAIDETQGEISDYLDKVIAGGEISQEEIDAYNKNVEFMQKMSEVREGKISINEIQEQAADIGSIDFEGNPEVAIEEISNFAETVRTYTSELNQAQKSLQDEFAKAYEEAQILHEYGYYSDDEYAIAKEALAQAEAVVQYNYEQRIAEAQQLVSQLSDQMIKQISDAAEAAASNQLSKGFAGIDPLAAIASAFTGNAGETYYYSLVSKALESFADVTDAVRELRTSTEAPIEVSVNAADALETLRKVRAEKEAIGDSNINVSTTGVTGYASGTDYAESGIKLVGENGPELLQFRGGERVYNAAETANILSDYKQIVMFLPQVMAALQPSVVEAPSAPNSASGIRYTITVNPTFYGGTSEAEIEGYSEKIADEIMRKIYEREEDARRNAYY